jgi:hypothetical protein
MAWIKTITFEDAAPDLREMLMKMRTVYPQEYEAPVPQAGAIDESIIESHTLIPDALYHSFSAFAAMMSPDLPLERRQHEMIATMVSLENDCFY